MQLLFYTSEVVLIHRLEPSDVVVGVCVRERRVVKRKTSRKTREANVKQLVGQKRFDCDLRTRHEVHVDVARLPGGAALPRTKERENVNIVCEIPSSREFPTPKGRRVFLF